MKLQLNEEIALVELEAENDLLQINKEFQGVWRSSGEIVTNEAVMQTINENIHPQLLLLHSFIYQKLDEDLMVQLLIKYILKVKV